MDDEYSRSLVRSLFQSGKGVDQAVAFCSALKAAVGADAVNLSVSDAQSLGLISTATCGSPLLPLTVFEDYNRRWLQHDPQVRLALSKKLAHGEIYLCSEHFGPDARKAEPFFAELLAGLGIAWCAGYLAQLDDQFAFGFLAYRAIGRPAFGADEKRILTPIARAMERAGDAVVALRRAAAHEQASLMALDIGARAALCLDHRFRLVWATAPARAKLAPGAPLRLQSGALTSDDTEALRRLKELVRQTALGKALGDPQLIAFEPIEAGKPVTVSVASVRAAGDAQWGAALITLDPPIGRAETAKLSPREREVVELVVLGRTTVDAARTLNIAETSVRTFLRRAFRKLGVRNQRELTRRLQVQGPDAPP
jgi:DNA-binding CsgD family transcriptional regulator